MNNLIIKDNEKIESLIYEIRGKQVMLDSDLGRLYGCANGAKTINQAVKRNIDRFPEDFYFQLTKEEYYVILKNKNTNLELEQGKYSKYYPYVFTEQGVAMLATILKTPVADIISIKVIDAFVYMRKYISYESKDNIIINHENRILKLE